MDSNSKADDWDEPLPSSSVEEEEEEDECSDAAILRRQQANITKLQKYVNRMAYRPALPPKTRPYDQHLSKPKKYTIMDNYDQFHDYFDPKLRAKRVKRLAGKYTAITTEQLEHIIKSNKGKERKREDLLKRKQELYYDMLTKLERQCRTQYLNVLIKKFAKFVADLATTMRIPPQLVDPYARMQRGIFCNILLAIGVQPTTQSAIYYTSQEAIEYDVCHRLAHALLSLIIKALDTAATKDPSEIMNPIDMDFEMDNYIKDRLMCAAEKKIMNERRHQQPAAPNPIDEVFLKCENFASEC